MKQHQRLLTDSLVFATHNAGKLQEISELLSPYGIRVRPSSDLGLPAPEETGATFEENAAIKARAAAQASGLPALADDSGLAVDALEGAPGVYSADWAGEPRDYQRAMARIKSELSRADANDHRAAFVCMLCLATPDGDVTFFEGRCSGELTFPPRGEGGFGYDPLFVPDGETRTFGEMTSAEKARFSHRAKAFAAFETACLVSR